MAEVLLEYTSTYAQTLADNERLGRLMGVPKLHWPLYARVPFFLLALVLTLIVGSIAGQIAGQVAAMLAGALAFGIMAVLWGGLIASAARSRRIKWMEEKYGPSTNIRLLIDDVGLALDTDTYTTWAKWSGIQAIDLVAGELFVRSKGFHLLISRDAFVGTVPVEDVVARLKARWDAAMASTAKPDGLQTPVGRT